MAARPAPTSLPEQATMAQLSARLQQASKEQATLIDDRESNARERDSKARDPNILILSDAEKILAEFDGREKLFDEKIARVGKIIAALRAEIERASEVEWIERKKKRLAEIRHLHGPVADAKYLELEASIAKTYRLVGEVQGIHAVGQAFNDTSDDRVGFVSLAEYRIRGARSSPLWRDLPRVLQPVFAGKEAHKIEPPKDSFIEELSPHRMAENVARMQRRFDDGSPGSLVRTVVGSGRSPATTTVPTEQMSAAPDERRSLIRDVKSTTPGEG